MGVTTNADVAGLMSRLRTAGVQVRADEGRLVLDAPRGAVDHGLLALVREHKQDLLRLLTGGGGGGATRIPPARPALSYPLSHAQQRLYFTQLLYPESVTYQILDVVRVDGPADGDRIEETLRSLIRRHEGFRTSFDLVGEEPALTVHDDVEFHLQRSREPDFSPERSGDFVRPFDLTAPPLLRARLVEVRPDLHYLLMDKHHLVFDAASRGTFARDFVRAHLGEPAEPLTVGYKDFAVWQNDLGGTELRRAGEHWDTVFADDALVAAAPAEAHPELFGTESRRAHAEFGPERTEALREHCRSQGLSPAMFLQAAYHLALHRFSGQDEVVVGFPVDVRADAGLDDQLGLYVNTVPVRSFPDARLPFHTYAATVRDGIVAGLDHSRFPYDAIVERASARRNVSEAPLVDGFFNIAVADTSPSPWARAGLTEVAGDPRAALPELPCLSCRFDLTLSVLEEPGSLRLELDCTTKLLDQDVVERIVRDLVHVIDRVVAEPGLLIGSLAGAAEAAR
ncbi:condensation domain-containing protein [Streptomyces niveus]|uniref:condensation domain-containing protein n=1 Tax=Streptomyces niveus TaxID=193462 RepID=UPI003628516D